MIRKENSSFLSDDEDSDPTASLVNMVDIMLVLAVGFLILAISSTGVMNMDDFQNQQSMNQSEVQTQVDVEQGSEIPNDIEQGSGAGSGYSRVGSVYKDPETGKLVMVDN
ncbi:MAG: hypothetical protein BZ137_09475 [Methanosphaera sp. rholeuAM130]|nr:MAG: hypothetical protein BZ137_09475 [Methanosphaera sp. rholeuAM130]